MSLALEYDIEFIRNAVQEYMEMRLEEQLNSRNGGTINHMTTLLGQFNSCLHKIGKKLRP